MNNETEVEVLKPAAVTVERLTHLWRLFFKRGMNPRGEIIFAFDGEKDSAIKRGREHCLRMNFKFIHVEPFLVDLDKSEADYKHFSHD